MAANTWREPVRMLGPDDPSQGLHRDGMSHYTDSPSHLYRAAVRALRALDDSEPREAEAAAAEVLQHPRHAQIVASFGRPTWFEGCTLRALGRARGHSCDDVSLAPGHGRCLPPGTDHPRLLRKKSKTVGLLLQPYDVSWTALSGLVDYCQQHRLEARIVGAGSYHYPSRTVAIVLTPAAQTTGRSEDDLYDLGAR